MTKQETAAAQASAMVDELGKLEAELAPFKSQIARVDVIRSALRASHKNESPAGRFQVDGKLYSALIGPMGNESRVDKALLFKLAGPKRFLEMASVTVGAISGEFAGAVVTLHMTGSRSLVIIPRAKP